MNSCNFVPRELDIETTYFFVVAIGSICANAASIVCSRS